MSDPLIIAGQEFGSRLFLGTAGYPNRKIMLDSIAASGTAMVTADVTKVDFSARPFKCWVEDDLYTADSIIVTNQNRK